MTILSSITVLLYIACACELKKRQINTHSPINDRMENTVVSKSSTGDEVMGPRFPLSRSRSSEGCIVALPGSARELVRREIESIGEGQRLAKGRTCVGSFARANVQRPQAKEAEREKKMGERKREGKTRLVGQWLTANT